MILTNGNPGSAVLLPSYPNILFVKSGRREAKPLICKGFSKRNLDGEQKSGRLM
jgi:hypothetical protein